MFSDEDDHEVVEDNDDIDDHEVVEEDNDDEDDLNYYEPDDFDYPDDKYEEFTDLDQKNNGTEVLSLQDICLLSISKNLARYNLGFSTTEDTNFRRHLQFLQRVHSSYLIKAATKYSKKLNESYFDFLLNQYIKEFDLDILYRCDRDIVIKRMSEIGHGFQKICFNTHERSDSSKAKDFVNTIVRHLANVEILDLNTHCNDSTLEIISSSCQQLKELYIDGCSVTAQGLKSLCQENGGNGNCLNLKHLSVSCVFNLDDGIAYLLQNMPSLEVIVYQDLPCILQKMHKDSENKILERKYNLTSLYLGANFPWDDNDTTTSDILTLYADICPHIKNLSLTFASKEYLDLCFKFQELEEISFKNTGIDSTLDINEFIKAKGGILRRLQLEKFTLSATVLTQNCPKLESLTLQNVTFQPLNPGAIFQPLNNLQELSLGYCNMSDAVIRRSMIDILNSSQKIEKLTLVCVKFENNEEFVTKLSKFCENEMLKHLVFTSCDVDDAFLQSVLFTCSNLKSLTLEYCDNLTVTHVDNLYEIANSLKSKTKIIWNDDRSEFNSIDSGDDIFDDYSGFDSDDYDNQDYDPYDSDNVYYGYDDIDDY